MEKSKGEKEQAREREKEREREREREWNFDIRKGAVEVIPRREKSSKLAFSVWMMITFQSTALSFLQRLGGERERVRERGGGREGS